MTAGQFIFPLKKRVSQGMRNSPALGGYIRFCKADQAGKQCAGSLSIPRGEGAFCML